MSGEETRVHGAVSDQSLCLALCVTSGTKRPLESAGVGNYPFYTHVRAQTHTEGQNANAELSTSLKDDRMGT